MAEHVPPFFPPEKRDDLVSPCVRNCCLNEQDICLGCFRHIDEITGWHSMTEQQKRTVLAHCQQRKQAIRG